MGRLRACLHPPVAPPSWLLYLNSAPLLPLRCAVP